MAIRNAIGFGIMIGILWIALPNVLREAEETIIAFLDGAQLSATAASGFISASAAPGTVPAGTPNSVPLLALPQAPLPPAF